MKSRLIVNPVSGSDAAPDYLKSINELLRSGIGEMDIVMTVAAGDALQAAERTAQEGYERLFVAGGDGTLNEVINGVARVQGAFERITFGVIPLGTGNDFAQALGLPEDVESAIDILLEGRTVEVDLGALNNRSFINVSAGGFIAEVSSSVDPHLKTVAGKFAYLIGGAQVLMDYEPVNTHIRLFDSENGRQAEKDVKMQMFAVCNSRMVGGGRLIAPHAIIDDGLLDICLVEAMPMLEFIGLLTRVSTGDHIEDERVTYFRTRQLELSFDRPIKVNTDGEVLETDHCDYRTHPGLVRFYSGRAPFASQ